MTLRLFADDDELVRMALASVLNAELGFQNVIEAGSLDEVLDRLGQGDDVGIALFDLAMPGMANASSLLAVREYFPDLRVAVVSSSNRRYDILLALSVGVHGYVPKMLGPRRSPTPFARSWRDRSTSLFHSPMSQGSRCPLRLGLIPRERFQAICH